MPRVARNRAFLAGAVFLLALNLRMGITSVGPVLPSALHELHASVVIGSLLTTLPVVLFGLMSPLGSRLGARFGTERTLVIALLLITLSTLARFWSASIVELIATALVLGVGIAMGNTLLPPLVRTYFPRHGPAMTGLYTVGINAGAGTASLVTPRVAAVIPSAWRGALAMWSIVAAIGICVWLAVARRATRTPEIRGAMPWRSRAAWITVVLFGVQGMVYYGLVAYMPLTYEGLGVSRVGAGALLFFFTILQVIGAITVSAVVQRTGRVHAAIRISSAVSALGLLLLAVVPAAAPLLVAAVLGIGCGAIFPVTMTLPLVASASSDEARRLAAFMLCFGYLLAASGPFLVAALRSSTGGFTAPFIVLAALSVLAIAAVAYAPRQPPQLTRTTDRGLELAYATSDVAAEL